MDETFTGLCKASAAEICTIYFSSTVEENFHCTGHSIHGVDSMEKRQVPLLQHFSNRFFKMYMVILPINLQLAHMSCHLSGCILFNEKVNIFNDGNLKASSLF